MAGFLRRKNQQEYINPIQTPEKPVQAPEEPSTPVYARFAKVLPPESQSRKPVTSPEPLGPKPTRPASQLSQASTANGSTFRPFADGPGARDPSPYRPVKTIPLQLRDKPLPAPVPAPDDDPLTEPPPPSKLPPNRRTSVSLEARSNGMSSMPLGTLAATSNRVPTSTAPGGPPLQSNDSRTSRRISTAPASSNFPANISQTSLLSNNLEPTKQSLFSRIKKSAVAPSSFTRPTTSPSSSHPLFRKSSVQDIPNKHPDSSRLRSSSRYSLAEDGLSRQLSANSLHPQPTFPSSGPRKGDPPSQPNVSQQKRRTGQDVIALQQQEGRNNLPTGRDPMGRVAARKDNQLPSASLSSENLKGRQNAGHQPQFQYQSSNMEVLRPAHPSHPLNGFPQVQPLQLPSSPPPPHPPPNSGPTRGKPLIFAASATMDDNISPDPFRYSQPSPPPRAEPYSQNGVTASLPRHTETILHSTVPSSQPMPPLDLKPPPIPEPLFVQPQTPPKQKKSRSPSVIASPDSHHHKTLTKQRPITPSSPAASVKKFTPDSSGFDLAAPVGIPLDDDPFAKPEGVRMLKPSSSLRDLSSTEITPARSRREGSGGSTTEGAITERAADNNPELSSTSLPKPAPLPAITNSSPPPSPEDYRHARSKRRGEGLEKAPLPILANVPVRIDRPAEPFPLDLFLADVNLLSSLLAFLTFYDWCTLSSISKKIRLVFIQNRPLTEAILERYLKTVGYSTWIWTDPDPLPLSLMDLHDYMRGVSIPTHEYARVAELYCPSLTLHPAQRDPILLENVRQLTAASRAYTRVVMRLRAQAEKEASVPSSSSASHRSPSVKPSRYASRASPSRSGSRPPSPTASIFSHSQQSLPVPRPATPVSAFRSPLYRLRRAPLLRVFVPSPDSDWLSDSSVLECEAELKRAGITHLLRAGDVVWDIAVGDEGNVGRLVWDGSYLIDLDYSYSAVGDLPKYLPTLAFPPSYFHRVIRTGPGAGNPLIRLDITPWGPEIAANLQLLQDRVRTETPQGNVHNVVRWVHRSSFVIRPPPVHGRQSTRGQPTPPRLPIPDSNLFIDPSWYGTVIVETEGTNECLADLQDRCGPGAFPPRAMPVMAHPRDKDSKVVFRILRERSRPGEIWIRTVSAKERVC